MEELVSNLQLKCLFSKESEIQEIAIPQIIHSRMGKGASGDIGRTSIRKIWLKDVFPAPNILVERKKNYKLWGIYSVTAVTANRRWIGLGSSGGTYQHETKLCTLSYY